MSSDPVVSSSSRPDIEAHVGVAVIGGGQAGLSISYYLKHAGIDHLVFEKETVTHTWRKQRWTRSVW